MEAVLLDPEGKSSFQALQAALGEGGDPELIVAYGFDLLYFDGNDLTRLPLTERKDRLKELLAKSHQSVLRYSEHFAVDGAEMYKQACNKGLEGIISKRADALYVGGRQKTWLKVKCSLRQEFIIIGYSGAKSGERALGALYVGYKKDGVLSYAGKVGTGFTMKSAGELAERLRKLKSAEAVLTRAATKVMGAGEWRALHWVKPELLCEVAFTEWTGDGRIRHPSFQGLREDKDASDVKQEKPMPTAAPSASNRPKTDVLIEAGVTISYPDRVISETGHITKGELAEYHAAIAPFMLAHISRHPLSLLRCPGGIDGKQCFFQRSPGKGLGKNVHSFDFQHKGKHYEYLYIEDAKDLLEIIQMEAIELHPWGASIAAIDYPDRLIFDLDPAPEVPFEALKLAATDLRQRLKRKGLDASLKCTGGKVTACYRRAGWQEPLAGGEGLRRCRRRGNGVGNSGGLHCHDEQDEARGGNLHRLLPQRLHGDGGGGLRCARPAGRSGGGTSRVDGTERIEVRQRIHDERCAETAEKPEAPDPDQRPSALFMTTASCPILENPKDLLEGCGDAR
jgi:bifunctional non-homologous end joining protein LigD